MAEAGHTRAGFLGTGAATLGGAALASAWSAGEAGAQTLEETEEAKAASTGEGAFGRVFKGSKFFFELEGEAGGSLVESVEGGLPSGEVVDDPDGGDGIARKHVGGIKWSPVSIKCGAAAMGKGMYTWIKNSLDRGAPLRTGTIKACDADLRVKAVGSFQNALLTEITLPALDTAVAKNPAYFTIKFQPQSTAIKATTGTVSGTPKASNVTIKMEIGAASSSRISKVDAITIKQREPGKIDFPNIKLHLSEGAGIETWEDYFESFVIGGGGADEANETDGSLRYKKGSQTVAAFSLSHLGPFKATPLKAGASEVLMDFYCEDIRLA